MAFIYWDSGESTNGGAYQAGVVIMTDLSICVPILSDYRNICRLTNSIKKYTSHIDYEVIIVDCGNMVRGYTQPMNQAMAAGRGKYLAALNDDIEVTEGWIDPLIQAIDDGAWCATSDQTASDGPQVFHPYCMLWNRMGWEFIGGLDEQFRHWCFGAGTLISTPDGLRQIEDIGVGDCVHSAFGYIETVEAVGQRNADTVYLTAHGLDRTQTTPDHPYWARRRSKGRNGWPVWGDPEWIPIGELQRSDRIAIPRATSTKRVTGRLTPEQAYIMGRWLADGWVFETDRRGSHYSICGALSEAKSLTVALDRAGIGYYPFDRPERNIIQINLHTDARGLLSECGRLARGKHVPSWLLGTSRAHRASLLRGYTDGDGNRYLSKSGTEHYRSCSVNRGLTHEMAQVARTLNLAPRIYRTERKFSRQDICGRVVNHPDVVYEMHYPASDSSYRFRPRIEMDDQFIWAPVRKVIPAGMARVYNLQVSDSNSFIADGVAVHNCSDIDIARRLVDAGHTPVKVPVQIQHFVNEDKQRGEVINQQISQMCMEDLDRFRRKWGVSAEEEKYRLRDLVWSPEQ
jgi:hypothetical protein